MDDPTTDLQTPELQTPDLQTPDNSIGVTLVLTFVLAVCLAIGLAIQLESVREPTRPVPPCGGLYDDCCHEWNDKQRDGLFDAEENFAQRRLPNEC